MRGRHRVLVALLLAVLPVGAVQAADCLNWRPAEVSIPGKIRIVVGYGPPGYGENPDEDQLRQFVLLDLDVPICLPRGLRGDPPHEKVSSINMITGATPVEGLHTGDHVRVSGLLVPREVGGITDVLFDYSGVDKVD